MVKTTLQSSESLLSFYKGPLSKETRTIVLIWLTKNKFVCKGIVMILGSLCKKFFFVFFL